VTRPTTWELRLTDGVFTVRADGAALTVAAGAPDAANLVITTRDQDLHRLLTRRLNPNEAIASGAASVDGDASQLQDLIELFTFPALDPAGVD
jgi:putative sterol carrier protein